MDASKSEGRERMFKRLRFMDSNIMPGVGTRMNKLLVQSPDAGSPDCLFAAMTLVMISRANTDTLIDILVDAQYYILSSAYRRVFESLGIDECDVDTLMLDIAEDLYESVREPIGGIDDN